MYIIRDREAGNVIDSFGTKEAAEKALAEYEQSDKDDGIYQEDFYEIVQKSWQTETVRKLREKSGLSQQKFADKCGIPFRTLQDWELGNRVPPEYVVEMLAKVVGLEDYNLKGYSFNEYSDKGGVGSEQIFKTKAEALKAARDYWEHLSERDKDDYRRDPGACFMVEEVSLAWDDTDMEFVRDNEAGGDFIWSPFPWRIDKGVR